MIRRPIKYSNYCLSKERTFTFTKAWANPMYGGSCLSGLRAKGKKDLRKNPLNDDIKKSQINTLYGGGYYVLEKVQLYPDDTHYYVDIYILTESIDDEN